LYWIPALGHLYVGHSSGTVYVLDLPGKALRRAIKAHESAVFGLEAHPTEPEGWSTGREGRFLYWDTQNSEPYASISVTPVGLRGFILAPDRERFLCAGRDGYLYEIHRARRQVTQQVKADPELLFTIQASPTQALFATGGKTGMLKLWGADLQSQWEVAAHVRTLNALAWHPDGAILATGGRDRLIHLWDITERKKILTLSGHQRSVNALIWVSPEMLASAGDDGLIKLWHLEAVPA
jgi:WD40 repeat protein